MPKGELIKMHLELLCAPKSLLHGISKLLSAGRASVVPALPRKLLKFREFQMRLRPHSEWKEKL